MPSYQDRLRADAGVLQDTPKGLLGPIDPVYLSLLEILPSRGSRIATTGTDLGSAVRKAEAARASIRKAFDPVSMTDLAAVLKQPEVPVFRKRLSELNGPPAGPEIESPATAEAVPVPSMNKVLVNVLARGLSVPGGIGRLPSLLNMHRKKLVRNLQGSAEKD